MEITTWRKFLDLNHSQQMKLNETSKLLDQWLLDLEAEITREREYTYYLKELKEALDCVFENINLSLNNSKEMEKVIKTDYINNEGANDGNLFNQSNFWGKS